MSWNMNHERNDKTFDAGKVKRLYGLLCRECYPDRYTEVSYAPLARRLRVTWYFAMHKNVEAIVSLRAALRQLERQHLVSVKPATHETVWVKLIAPKSREMTR